MDIFEESLLNELQWRVDEISILRTIPYLHPLSVEQRTTIEKHTIPAIYSLWEGFVVASMSLYIREINNEKLTAEKLNLHLLTYAIDSDVQFKNGRSDFEKKKIMVQILKKHFNQIVLIPSALPTESNVNFKVVNKILHVMNLDLLPERPYKKQLDKLLLIRNHIAHGESSIPIDQEMIKELSFAVMDLMDQVFFRIIIGLKKQTYLAT